MINKEEITKVAITVVCSFALVFIVYNLAESVRYNGFFIDHTLQEEGEVKKKGNLLYYLRLLDNGSLDKTQLIIVLETLLEYSAFTEAQNKFNHLGYLPKITELLDHSDNYVKQKAALLINNLVLNEENLSVLKKCIPQLIHILATSNMDVSSIELFASVLCALTNFTTLNESHSHLMPHLHVLYQILQECDVVHIKLQVLKILVNLSTNKKICENMLEFDAQLLRCMESYIGTGANETFVLRAVTCCANVLASLQRRWRYGSQPTVATPEFISSKVQDELLKLSLHQNEDIRFQARRCITALRPPPTPTSSAHSLDTLDILEVLKL